MKIVRKSTIEEDRMCCINVLQEKSIECVREDGDDKRIKNKNRENQCCKKATKTLNKKIGKHKCGNESKNFFVKLRKVNREKNLRKLRPRREKTREKN